MLKSLFINCDQATTICDKSQYGEATLYEKIKLKIHFLRCRICALYTKQNTMMTKICNQNLKETKKVALTDKEKTTLKEKLSNM